MIRILQQYVKFTIVLLLLLFSQWLHAQSPVRITVLLSGESQLYFDAVAGITERLDDTPNLKYKLTILRGIKNQSTSEIKATSDYIIAVGTKAFRHVSLENISIPTLNILVSKRSYQTIIKKSPSAIKSSVIYLEQPTERLLLLAKLALKDNAKKIGMIFGPTSVLEKHEYMVVANKLSLQLISKIEVTDKISLDVIEKLIKTSNAYIALYDQKVMNRKTAKWLLYMANVYRKPVIAYSKAYVEAGALAAIYTTPADAGRSAADWLYENIKNNKNIIWKRYPLRFSVDINRRIASKLNLFIDDQDVIKANIKAAEGTK